MKLLNIKYTQLTSVSRENFTPVALILVVSHIFEAGAGLTGDEVVGVNRTHCL